MDEGLYFIRPQTDLARLLYKAEAKNLYSVKKNFAALIKQTGDTDLKFFLFNRKDGLSDVGELLDDRIRVVSAMTDEDIKKMSEFYHENLRTAAGERVEGARRAVETLQWLIESYANGS